MKSVNGTGLRIAQTTCNQYLLATDSTSMNITIPLPIYSGTYTLTINLSTDPSLPGSTITNIPNIQPSHTLATNNSTMSTLKAGKVIWPIILHPHQPAVYTYNHNNLPTPEPPKYLGIQARLKANQPQLMANINPSYHTPSSKPHTMTISASSSTNKTTTFAPKLHCSFGYNCMNWLDNKCRFAHELTPEQYYRQNNGSHPPAYYARKPQDTKVNYLLSPDNIIHNNNPTYNNRRTKKCDDETGKRISLNPATQHMYTHNVTLRPRTSTLPVVYDLNEMHLNNKSIFNLSSEHFTNEALDFLALGLNFIPVPKNPHPSTLLDSHDDFARRIRLRKHFMHQENNSNHTLQTLKRKCDYKTNWEPPKAGQFLEQYISHSRKALESYIDHILSTYNHNQRDPQPNLSKALLQLKRNTNIIIKSADKNLGPVIMDKDAYITLATSTTYLGDSSTYTKYLSKPSWEPAKQNLITILTHHKHIKTANNEIIYSELATVLLHKFSDTKPEYARAYFTPKMHKSITPVKLRPVNSTIVTPTCPASTFLDLKLQPYLSRIPSYIKGATDIILQLHNKQFPQDIAFLAADVESLYPSIPTGDGLIKLQQFLIRHNHEANERKLILSLAEWVLNNNIIEFNNEYYLQISGTAMGTPFAVMYACIFLAELEHELHTILVNLQKYDPHLYLPLLLRRFVDDIFGIFRNRHSAQVYLKEYERLKPYIKLTSTISNTNIDILDITVYKSIHFTKDGILHTTLYQKPHNKFLFIPPYSFHDKNYSWITEYVNRIRLYCTEDSQYAHHTNNLHTHLCNRGHISSDLAPYFKTQSRTSILAKALGRAHTNNKKGIDKKTPILFKLINSPLTLGAHKDLKRILALTTFSRHDTDIRAIFQHQNAPILAIKDQKLILHAHHCKNTP